MKFKALLCLIPALSFVACSDDSGSASSSAVSNPITATYSTLANKLDQVDFYDAATNSSVSNFLPRVAFGTKWDDTAAAQWPDPSVDGGSPAISTKEMMGYEIDAQSVRDNGSTISVVGRTTSAMQIMCAVGVGFGSSSGYPADGTQTLTFNATLKAQMVSQCDFQDAASVADGSEITITLSTPSDTTLYDKKAEISLTDLGGGTQIYYFKSSATEINVATSETYDIDGLSRLSRTVVSYDITNDILKSEYISGPNIGELDDTGVAPNTGQMYAEFFRLFFDGANDEGYIMSSRGQDGNTAGTTKDYSNQYFNYILAGKPNTTGAKFSISMQSNSLGDTSIYEACVNGETGDIGGGDDGARCGGSDLAGIDVSTATVVDSDAFLNGYDSANYNSVGEATALVFTDETDFHTAAISQN